MLTEEELNKENVQLLQADEIAADTEQKVEEEETLPLENEGEEQVETPAEQSADQSDESTEEPVEQPTEKAADDELALPERKAKKEMPTWVKKKEDKWQEQLKQRDQEIAQLRDSIAKANQGQQQQQRVLAEPEPLRNQYNTDDEYFQAALTYKEKEKNVRRQMEQQQQMQESYYTNQNKQLEEIGRKAHEAYDDFDDFSKSLGGDFPYNAALVDAVIESKYSTDVIYFLAKHPQEAHRIAMLPNVKAANAIFELGLRFKERDKSTSSISKAPAPIKSINTNRPQTDASLQRIAESGSQADFDKKIAEMESSQRSGF